MKTFLFLAIMATATSFVVPTAKTSVVSNKLSTSKLTPTFITPPKVIAGLAGPAVAALIPSIASATEGTNEWFGVDDGRLLAVLFLGHWAILSLYLGWSKKFDEDEDFFGEIDYTGVGKK